MDKKTTLQLNPKNLNYHRFHKLFLVLFTFPNSFGIHGLVRTVPYLTRPTSLVSVHHSLLPLVSVVHLSIARTF